MVSVAVIGAVATHADRPARTDLGLTPVQLLAAGADLLPTAADLLNSAMANLAKGTDALHGIDLAHFPDFTNFITDQAASQASDSDFLGLLQSAEDYLATGGPSLSGELLSVYSYLVNLGWDLDSLAVLSLDRAVASAFENGAPGFAALGNYGLFLADLGIFGQSLESFVINLASLAPVSPSEGGAAATDIAAATGIAATTTVAAASGAPACDCPTLTPQLADGFLELVKKIDGSAFTFDLLGLYENHDVIGTVAMQINLDLASNKILSSLGLNLISSAILAGDWKSTITVSTDFFEEFVTHFVGPGMFTSADMPADPDNVVADVAYGLDVLLTNTVFASDLNAAALVLWP